jgi:hypothetical protein
MSWPQAFVAVPTGDLVVDQLAAADPRREHDLGRDVAQVPRIYQLLRAGSTDADFRRMCEQPASAAEREVGEAYRHLFSTSPGARPVRAQFTDGVGLHVVEGAEHARAATDRGVPFVPVHVSAADDATLARLTRHFEEVVGREAPDVVELHRAYDSHFRSWRDGAQAPEVARRTGDRHETDRPWAPRERLDRER